MSAITKLLRKLRRTDGDKIAADTEVAGINRREFLQKALYGSAVVSSAWLVSDKLFDEYGGSFEEAWLKDYYKSDFVGV